MATYKELSQAVKNYQTFGTPQKTVDDTRVQKVDGTVPVDQTPEEEQFEKYGPRAIDVVRHADKFRGLTGSESYFEPALADGWGESRYDRRTGYTPGMDVEEARANAQPAAWKIGNGIIKGGVTAATTAANTLVGTVFGAGAAAFDYNKQMIDSFLHNTKYNIGETIDAGVNNFVSERLVGWQKLADEVFPNYRTAEERSEQYQREWWKHIGTANFIGDSILKNFGFTVGAIGAGAVWSKILGKAMSAKLVNDLMKGATVAAEGDAAAIQELVQAAQAIPTGARVTVDAAKFTGNLKRAAQQINKASSKLKLYGAAFGAMGESSMEGLMAKDEFFEEQLPRLRQEYMVMLQEAEEDILNSNDPALVDTVYTLDVDGNPVQNKVLTQDGQIELYKRRMALQQKYDEKLNATQQLGDRLASITYGLNFPVLTGADVAVFGRVLSGGWKTARTLRGVRGAAGAYRGILSNMSEKAAVRTMSAINAVKSAGIEAGQEMYQGFASAGLEGAGGNMLTEYNDAGFDDKATGSMRDWLGNIWPGGAEYLSDPKNWQEGFLGALTGLFGIPGRGYFAGERGGIPEAIAEAKQQVRESREAADKLNKIVNDPEFQSRWRSYIRHLKYDNDMEDALATDDKKKWTDASEKQLISDIMAFAKVGRLDDLKQIAESFKSKTADDADDIRDATEGEDPSKQVVTKNKSDEDVVAPVVKQATKLVDAIDEYSDIYDALQTLAPANYSDDLMEELVFTAMNIKSTERRYLEMLDEAMEAVDKVITPRAEKNIADENERQAAITRTKADLERAFSSRLPGGDNTNTKESSKKVVKNIREKLGKVDANLNKLLDDMEKVSDDRYDLYNKYQKLLSGEAAAEYAKQAETQEKKKEKNAKKQVNEEAKGYQTIDDVKASYRDLVQHRGLATEFFQQLEQLASTSKPVKDFLELHETNSDFRTFYEENGFSIPADMQTAKHAESIILERMFDEAQTKQQYLDFDFNFDSVADDGTVIPGGRVKLQLTAVTGPTIQGMGGVDIIGNAYAQAMDSIQTALAEYKRVSNYVSGRTRTTTKPQNAGAAPTLGGMTGGSKPTVRGMAGQPEQAAEPEGEGHADVLGREWHVGQKLYKYELDKDGDVTPIFLGEYTVHSFFDNKNGHMMHIVDGDNRKTIVNLDKKDVARFSAVKQEEYEPAVDDTAVVVNNQEPTGGTVEVVKTTNVNDMTPEEEQELGEEETVNEGGPKHYYRTGMPEVSSFKARDIRKILKSDLTLREKLAAIFRTHLRDFYLEDENYRPTWQMLSNFQRTDAAEGEGAQNAFMNTAFVASVGDKVEFRIDPKFNILDADGNPQILVYTVKDGKSYLLSTLGHNTSRTEYENIGDLRTTILEQYAKQDDKSKVFVFTNEKTGEPYRSTIWSKRNGIVVYNENTKESGYVKEKPIKDIPGYDKDAPIVFINKTGEQIQLSGAPYNREHLSSLSEDTDCHGNLYYLAWGKNGYCIPIRLNVEHFTKDTSGYSNPVMTNIRSAIKELATKASELLNSDITDVKAANTALAAKVQTLGRYLDIHDHIFRIVQKKDGTFAMRVWVNGNKGFGRWFGSNEISEDSLRGYFEAQKLSVNIGETSSADSLLNNNILTSNAQALWAKGTDIYYYRWNGEDFEKYGKQDDLSTRKPAAAQEETTEEKPLTKEAVKEAVGDKSKTSVTPTEQPAAPATENELETKVRELLTGKVGDSDLNSVVQGVHNAVRGQKTSRLLDGLRMFGSSSNSEESEKAFIYILGAVTTKSERTVMRAEIAKANDIPENEVTTFDMFERYVNREDDDELMNRIANVVAYSNFVRGAISALSGESSPKTDAVEEQDSTNDIKSEMAAIDYNIITFSKLSETLQKLLTDSGCDAETFDSLSPEGKQSALSCIGI